MSKCSLCRKRKAKRKCPALGKSICSLCCGSLRGKEINCPDNCVFLTKHKPYQDKRFLEKKAATTQRKTLFPEPDILQDERLSWLVFNIEAILMQAGKNKGISDNDILFSLNYAREKIEKEKSLLIVPGINEPIKQKNDLGEFVFQTIENCRYEKRIILPGEYQKYTKEEKMKCIDRIMLSVNHYMGEEFNQRNYLNQLFKRFSRIKNHTKL